MRIRIQKNTFVKIKQWVFFLFIPGNSFLHTPMAMEKLGSGQNSSPNDGLRLRNHIRSRETIKEKITP